MANQINGQGQEQRTVINIDVSKLDGAVCNCGCRFYDTVMEYKLISALMSPSGQEQLFSIPHAACTNCGNIYSMEEIVKMAKGEEIDAPPLIKS